MSSVVCEGREVRNEVVVRGKVWMLWMNVGVVVVVVMVVGWLFQLYGVCEFCMEEWLCLRVRRSLNIIHDCAEYKLPLLEFVNSC